MKIQTNIYKEFHNKSTSDDRRHEILKDNPAFGHQLWLLQMIGKVFGYERKLKGKNAGLDEILKVREELELPILKDIHVKILEIQEKFLPSGKFSAAMNYIVKQQIPTIHSSLTSLIFIIMKSVSLRARLPFSLFIL